MKKVLSYLLIGIASASTVLLVQSKISTNSEIKFLRDDASSSSYSVPAAFTSLNGSLPSDAFVLASEVSMPTVVHITTKAKQSQYAQGNPMDLFEYFFGQPFSDPRERKPQKNEDGHIVPLGSGSGVIISKDGYIVTNNHVIDGADEIEVILNDNRSFKAKLIGTDPNTDIALIKVESKEDLTPVQFGNSDATKVGQWVLAVGNPFNLASTVTAGIISAKARNINLLQQKAGTYAIESFIQTDAAVNPGNSGGALVDLNGDLIGINTAIASPSGVYAGYAFAIPSNLVKKVIEDLKDYGVVQRGYMGISMGSVDDKLAKDLNLDKVEGAYISDVQKGSGADDAGLKGGDIITKINSKVIKTSPELQEMVARFRPGDKIQVEYLRDNKTLNTTVTLKSKNNTTELVTKEDLNKSSSNSIDLLGLELEPLSTSDARKMGLSGGVKIKKINKGIIQDNTDIQEGFIITSVNRKPIASVDDLKEALNASRGDGVLLQGKYPGQNGSKYYAFGF
ncbi:MAG: Do family serine endopeptidase [Chitinophagales bacterium]|nr:Do family serine endopeptidase [Chitinophagales bacterium]MCZ2393794.1 Do family serine endopeptidase [Chitinophagales bacterium]